jgi:3-deoxy-7-phosphoheptulonate synthase
MTAAHPIDALFDSARVAAQQPSWPDQSKVESAVKELRSLPPLVFAGECDNLKAKVAEAAAGKAFWLQGGDCRGAAIWSKSSGNQSRADGRSIR